MPIQQVIVPDIGGAEGAEVIELLVAVGDQVVLDQGLIVLESDKASMEIPATAAGTVVELLVAEGDQLAEGAAVAMIDVAEQVADAAPTPGEDEATAASDAPSVGDVGAEQKASAVKEAPVAKETPVAEAVSAVNEAPVLPVEAAPLALEVAGEIYAGPAVRKLARELGVQLVRVDGTGPQGRVLKEDLQQFVRKVIREPVGAVTGGTGIPSVPETDFAKFGEVEVTPRTKLDKLTAINMHRSWVNVPHVTQFDEADITDLEEFRAGLKAEAEQRSTRITPLPFLLKACALALRDNPKINSSLARGGEDLVHKKYIHIGVAVDTPAGLMVPVIRDVDRKTIWELAHEVAELASRARDRKLLPAEMQGGCFTVSSLGNIGGNGFTPIVNTPEVAILGVSKAAIKPLWNGAEFAPRTMLPVALSYDHRVVNGGDGGRFLTRIVSLLSDIRQLSL
ncbi:2-oxo acid dehydrogenase subunit E2 [Halioglobus sp. Uisw_031]|uniref:2-oxo acid dehydrogenase subunit E2 n=1 Tax=Halioglobus sp. Uisw_031 TaxID=3230977 RepID=UPI0039ED8F76